MSLYTLIVYVYTLLSQAIHTHELTGYFRDWISKSKNPQMNAKSPIIVCTKVNLLRTDLTLGLECHKLVYYYYYSCKISVTCLYFLINYIAFEHFREWESLSPRNTSIFYSIQKSWQSCCSFM